MFTKFGVWLALSTFQSALTAEQKQTPLQESVFTVSIYSNTTVQNPNMSLRHGDCGGNGNEDLSELARAFEEASTVLHVRTSPLAPILVLPMFSPQTSFTLIYRNVWCQNTFHRFIIFSPLTCQQR